MSKEVWVVVGEVTDPDLYENAKVGDLEYQFSDGPPGARTMSYDFVNLSEGLAAHKGCILHWVFIPSEQSMEGAPA